ncbi:hypothetical protein HSX37_16620|uniref:Formylmethanofuran dehydrogenase subunit E n=1 Tax=Dendrosporobacter quercicolus TaxID=146817 RepID=A0A1G9XI53_9FIRM|nr:hypothetical protein [Dendrosporobacter quercicolus]NSL49657.1 hypothetical protein [Dendrosporobacter quercicolus DSM 1736]SDM96400.1 hypothetical protein SAMN04488502_109111 [Dendrosporobacter quercicolus]
MHAALSIKDGNDLLTITYEDMVKYHGRQFIGGVALAYKLLELAFRVLTPGEPPVRDRISVILAVYGPGIIDGIEMATRALTRGALTIKPQLAAAQPAPDAADGQGGRYYFEIAYGDDKLMINLKSGLLPDEFIRLAYKTHDGTISEAEQLRLQELKEAIAQFLLRQKAEDLFDYRREGLLGSS